LRRAASPPASDPSQFPPLRAAKRQRGEGQGGRAIRSQAPKGSKWLGKIKLHTAYTVCVGEP